MQSGAAVWVSSIRPAKCKSGPSVAAGVLPALRLTRTRRAAEAGASTPQEAGCLLAPGQRHPWGNPSAQTSEAVSVEFSSSVVLIR